MKLLRYTAIACMSIIVLACIAAGKGKTGKGEYILKGKVSEKYDAPLKVFLSYYDGKKMITDSAILHKGEFELKGTLTEPFQASLNLQHDIPAGSKPGRRIMDAKQIWVQEGETMIAGDDFLSKATISGSSLNEEQKAFDLQLKPLTDKEQLFQDTMIANSSKDHLAANKKYEAQMRTLLPEKKELMAAFIKAHPDSYLSLVITNSYLSSSPDIAEIGPLYAGLSKKIKQTPKGKETTEVINRLKDVQIGAQAPPFTQKDTSGNEVRLADFKGKYVLVDFWASWCLPCRAENPDVLKAYNEYKSRNFTVLGVSLDAEKARAAWIQAIQKDNLPWTQVSDLKFWENAAAKLYGVRAIPANFLVDPNGKIIAKNLHGDELGKTLARYLDR